MKKFSMKSAYLMVAILLTSCEKYLDQNPDMRTEINTVEKVAQLVTTAYPDRNYYAFTETASDNVEDKTAAMAIHNDDPYRSLYFWQDVDDDGNGTPTEYWNACYGAIASANQALESIEEYNLGDDVLPFKGEALIARAYAHFMLVTFFAKAYEIGGSNDSPGVPYVSAPETTPLAQYSRGTVAEVYEKVETDLNAGIALLPGGIWKVPKYHFTSQAAHAFAARFYLFKGDWDKVIEHVNAILPDGNFKDNLRPYNSTMRTYSFEEYAVEFNKADKNYNLLLTSTYSTYQRSTGTGGARYGFGETKKNLYNSTTVFGAPFYGMLGSWGAPNYSTNKLNEYFHVTDIQANTGFPYIMAPMLTVDEALMNRAEAYLEKGQNALVINDLNTFASVRINNYNPAIHSLTLEKAKAFFLETDDKQALLESILHAKQISFFQEGIRWMDILRRNLTVEHNHIDAAGQETFDKLEPDDPRRVFQIPKEAAVAGVELNPR